MLFRSTWLCICAVAPVMGGCSAKAPPPASLPAPQYAPAPDPPPIPVIMEHEPDPELPVPGSDEPFTDAAVALGVREELSELHGEAESGLAPIEVAVERGVVMLTGRVPTLRHAALAAERASTVRWVRGVVNRLEVAPVTVPDPELEARVRSRLKEHPALGDIAISVSSRLGRVHLAGVARSYTEKELAAEVASSVRGVREVINGLTFVPSTRPDREILRDVLARIGSDAFLSDDPISAEVEQGVVSLSGAVGTFMEKRRAQTQGWVSGARGVDVDRLLVAPARRAPHQRLIRPVLTDAQVELAVNEALRLDPRVPAGTVSAGVQAGIARLRGVVPSLISKRAAEQDAASTLGVWRVESAIEVSPAVPPTDSALARTIRERLVEEDAELGLRELHIAVKSGPVTIGGAAKNPFERAAIIEIVEGVPGVVGVEGPPRISPERADALIERDIERALQWDPRVDGSEIDIEVRDGIAVLQGRAPSLAIHDAIIENVWQAQPRSIEDRLQRALD